ncbi:sulfite exporter TauE/SafE family protein [Candidatus Contendibacter odensensis]|uniref:Probable membrane transporter protein n=1 Tax=Candidatus Contendobacter odensis Run_B_J11 TaxID=1400861 RepID=A0A7U7GD88_9GAMM|nr:sulfite exporter TauE/SafE family protein [Candidatus Contendobacter odensis]CDH46142.1 conserved membrane hypothetical protein [Candidatus Contendobacter odensis Run_B_J11]
MQKFVAFIWGGVIGVLGGLIGLGGAEFRLPVLVSVFKFPTLDAIILNLMMSLVTVIFALAFRVGLAGLEPIAAQMHIVLNILAGSLAGSWIGVHFATRIDEWTLTRAVAILLIGLSGVLIGHEIVSQQFSLVIPAWLQIPLGVAAGVVIGVFSGMLGVAGGELIIPTLILLFALDIKLAGSLSLAISIPTIIIGLTRYILKGRARIIAAQSTFVIAMALGSIVGAWIGSLLLGFAPSSMLHVLLGIILLASAIKLLGHHRPTLPKALLN